MAGLGRMPLYPLMVVTAVEVKTAGDIPVSTSKGSLLVVSPRTMVTSKAITTLRSMVMNRVILSIKRGMGTSSINKAASSSGGLSPMRSDVILSSRTILHTADSSSRMTWAGVGQKEELLG